MVEGLKEGEGLKGREREVSEGGLKKVCKRRERRFGTRFSGREGKEGGGVKGGIFSSSVVTSAPSDETSASSDETSAPSDETTEARPA